MRRTSRLPIVDLTRRDAILRGPATREHHTALLAELPFRDFVEAAIVDAEAPHAPPSELRIVAWNAQRGHHPDAAAALLGALDPDVLLLSELDVGMTRTGQRHTARDLAERLSCGYAYAVEFLELGAGDEHERAEFADRPNALGYHGGAILSRLPLAQVAVVRLDSNARWFGESLGERRVGSRIAVVATVETGGEAATSVGLASVHLESHSGPDIRADQMDVLLRAIEERSGGGPFVIGGDLNTHSLSMAALDDRDALVRELREDRNRLENPVPHEPLFDAAARAGFEWVDCNLAAAPTHRTRDGGGLKLDWLMCRGVTARDARVVPARDEHGNVLSDHDAVCATVSAAWPA